MPHRTAGCGKSSLRPLMAGSSPSLPDGSNPSAAIVQSASDVQCSRLLKTTNDVRIELNFLLIDIFRQR
uniref:BsuBI-PstI family restriction endonuclease n=1 Tax=Enterobacter cloacae TaxID=550 RepID=A0A0G3B6Z6_ENTCL|nr:BsuBI-PstI family restriction endonuclease [Enterobacter cloacae]